MPVYIREGRESERERERVRVRERPLYVFTKGKQFLPLIRFPSCYSYNKDVFHKHK
jgi:hypothetical protein